MSVNTKQFQPIPFNPNRAEEIRRLLLLTPDRVIKEAGSRLRVCENLDHLHRQFAQDVFHEIKTITENRRSVQIVLPVGPVGQYDYLVDLLNRNQISLENVWLFFMDEYCDASGKTLPPDHPLSFRGIAHRLLLSRLSSALKLQPDHIIIPDENNYTQIDRMIENLGGLDTVYGGIGIHGHLAFNEPQTGIAELGTRKVVLNPFTITINAVRAMVGGNLECFPNEAYTIGMRQILSARRIRLYCRNGTPYDWANTILRLALFGDPGDDYPVTWIRNKDYLITTDKDTLATPRNIL
jgi:glucosamine-6-phosphate deaminase